VFTLEELNIIANIMRENEKIIAITDEVYEFMIYDNNPFVRFCTLGILREN
jgi:aspartate/methionine/tyrosine aminotransferase